MLSTQTSERDLTPPLETLTWQESGDTQAGVSPSPGLQPCPEKGSNPADLLETSPDQWLSPRKQALQSKAAWEMPNCQNYRNPAFWTRISSTPQLCAAVAGGCKEIAVEGTQSLGTLCSFIFNALKAWFEQMKSMGICHKFETTKLMLNYIRPFPSVFHPWLLTHTGQDMATKVQ